MSGLLLLVVAAAAALYFSLRKGEGDSFDSVEFPKEPEYPFRYEEATDELKEQAAAGDVDAQFELAVWLASEADDERAPGEYSELMMTAARRGHAAAAVEIGNAYLQGKWGLTKDPIEAIAWFEKAAAKGEYLADYQLGMCYRDGVGVDRNDVRSFQHLFASAKKGYAPAQFGAHLALREGVGVGMAPRAARRALSAARSQGYGHREFVSDNLYLDDGSRLAGAFDPIGARQGLGREYAHAVRCAALEGDLSQMGRKILTADGGEVGVNDIRSALADGGFAGKASLDIGDLRTAMFRVAALLGDPVAQRLYSERLGKSDETEAAYWRGRSQRNPLRRAFPEGC